MADFDVTLQAKASIDQVEQVNRLQFKRRLLGWLIGGKLSKVDTYQARLTMSWHVGRICTAKAYRTVVLCGTGCIVFDLQNMSILKKRVNDLMIQCFEMYHCSAVSQIQMTPLSMSIHPSYQNYIFSNC